MIQCGSCSRTFNSIWGKHAHEKYHSPIYNHVQDAENYVAWNDIQDLEFNNDSPHTDLTPFDFEYVYDDLIEECRRYIENQRRTLSTELVRSLEAGYPLLLDKSRKKKGDIRTYFEVINLVINMKTITMPECNDLILCFRKVTRMNGNEIPLPARFSTILDNVMRNVSPIKSRIRKQDFPLCRTLFPDDIVSHLPVQQGVVTDIVKVVSKYNF
jgi:hypothetical protein